MTTETFGKSGLVVVLAAVALGACSKTPVKPAAVDAAPSTASLASSSLEEAGVPEPSARVVDLVYATKTLVAVSSKVQNPRDYPEHLIDNKPETAWNSETGDLKGWIAFRVPKDAHADYLTITCGFDKVAKDGTDLFTANHRIKKIALERDGVKLGEHTLDTNVRTPQRIEIDKDGGEFKLKVLETVPGTNEKWRELVVSEVHLMGKTPAITRGIGERPRVLVGSFDAHDNEVDPPKKTMKGPFPDLATYCRTQRALVTPTFPERERSYKKNWDMDVKLVAKCDEVKLKTPPTLHAPFHELSSVRYETGDAVMRTLVVRTDAGWIDLPSLELDIDAHFDPGCFSIFRGARFDAAKVVDGPVPVLLLRWYLLAEHSLVTSGQVPDEATIKLQACRLKDGAAVCDEPIAVNETIVPKGRSPKWRKDAKYTITNDGRVKWLAPPSGTSEDPTLDFLGTDAGRE